MLTFNDKKIEFKKFPNGEIIIDKQFIWDNKAEEGSPIKPPNRIGLWFESNEDMFNLFLFRKALWMDVALDIYYMPYSRMDRKSDDYVFTLKSVAKFINFMDFKTVRVYEPHSDVTPALLNKCKIINLTMAVLDMTKFNYTEDYICFPDAGAQKRYSDQINIEHELVGLKKRDFRTGRISHTQVIGAFVPGSKVYIVDDLCSKGGTFAMVAEELKIRGAIEINLVVAHCETNIFKGKLLNGGNLIDHVYTTDILLHSADPSEINANRSRLTVFPVKSIQ